MKAVCASLSHSLSSHPSPTSRSGKIQIGLFSIEYFSENSFLGRKISLSWQDSLLLNFLFLLLVHIIMGLLKATKDLEKYPQCCEIGTIFKACSNLIALTISQIHCISSVICFYNPCNLLTQAVTFFFLRKRKRLVSLWKIQVWENLEAINLYIGWKVRSKSTQFACYYFQCIYRELGRMPWQLFWILDSVLSNIYSLCS